MLYFSFHLLFLSSILYRFLSFVPFTLLGGGIWPTDLLLFFIIIIFLVRLLFSKKYLIKLFSNSLPKYIILIIILLLVPILVGIINDHVLVSILRDSRSIFVYIIPLLFPLAINNKEKWIKYYKFMLKTTLLAIILFYVMLIMKIELPGKIGMDITYITRYGSISHGYGISTALFYYPLAFFTYFNFWLDSEKNKVENLIFSILSLFPILYYSMRALSFGVIIVFLYNLIRLKPRRLVVIIYSLVLITSIIFLISPITELVKIPQVERHLSLFFPEISTSGVAANRNVRLRAINVAIRSKHDYLFGSGYGEIAKNRYSNFMLYWNHSSPGWLIFRLGYIGSILFIILIFLIIKKSFWLIKQVNGRYMKTIMIANLLVLFVICFTSWGTNIFFRGDGISLIVSINLGMMLSAEYFMSNIFKSKIYDNQEIK